MKRNAYKKTCVLDVSGCLESSPIRNNTFTPTLSTLSKKYLKVFKNQALEVSCHFTFYNLMNRERDVVDLKFANNIAYK